MRELVYYDMTLPGIPLVAYFTEDINGVPYEWATLMLGMPLEHVREIATWAFDRARRKLGV